MIYTIKDEKGNMICSIENVDPTKSEEGIAAGLVFASIVGSIWGISKITSAINKSKVNKIAKLLGEEKMNFFQNYLKNTDSEVLNIVNKSFDRNKSLFPQMTKFEVCNGFNNSGKLENKKLIKSILKNKMSSEDKLCFDYEIDAYYKYADLKKMGIEWDDNKSVEENLDIQFKYEDKLDRMHDKALKSLDNWFKKSISDIETPMKLNNGCELVSVSLNKNDFYGDDIDARNCEYVAGYIVFVSLKHSPKFINEILNPIKEAIKNKTL